ncbi:MAG: hypothetical protein DCF22_10955 [Leptolyngbya sp.]|nr:MAG: hypothetical protein DCF22_10955 [Leptolyngbya sp.]
MDSSNRWRLIKLVLVQAYILLGKMEEAMNPKKGILRTSSPLKINGTTNDDLTQAKNCIANLINDEEALIKAAQYKEFNSLVNELESAEIEITKDDMNLVREWQEKGSFWSRFKFW